MINILLRLSMSAYTYAYTYIYALTTARSTSSKTVRQSESSSTHFARGIVNECISLARISRLHSIICSA